MLSQEAAQKILGIEVPVSVIPEEMAKQLTVTFYPFQSHKVSTSILNFGEKLKNSLKELGVKVIPYEEAVTDMNLNMRFKLFFYTLIGKIPRV
jgi:hypothetical protein